VRFEPILGRPHPASPAELALHAAIEADAELSGGFAYNAPVRGGSGRRLVVDVLERAGDLVVEVDGFRFHASRRRFADDRHRDFELLAVGRRVLRLTADEILADVPRALDKIRAVRAPRRADALDGGPTTR
jgi:very-short-patch-repair endonuclease